MTDPPVQDTLTPYMEMEDHTEALAILLADNMLTSFCVGVLSIVIFLSLTLLTLTLLFQYKVLYTKDSFREDIKSSLTQACV